MSEKFRLMYPLEYSGRIFKTFGKLLSFFLFLSFFISCSNRDDRKIDLEELGYLKEPKRPLKMNLNAQWLGSYDSYGQWIWIEGVDDQNNVGIIFYDYVGSDSLHLSYKGKYKFGEKEMFKISEPYKIISISNNEFVTVVQSNDTIIFFNEANGKI